VDWACLRSGDRSSDFFIGRRNETVEGGHQRFVAGKSGRYQGSRLVKRGAIPTEVSRGEGGNSEIQGSRGIGKAERDKKAPAQWFQVEVNLDCCPPKHRKNAGKKRHVNPPKGSSTTLRAGKG